MEPISFAEFLAEREKLFAASFYGLNKKGQTPGMAMAKGAVRPASPAKMFNPYQGVHFPHIYGKDDPRPASGVIGKKSNKK